MVILIITEGLVIFIYVDASLIPVMQQTEVEEWPLL